LLRDRLLSAALLISATLLLIWLDHQYPLLQTRGLWLVPLLFGFTFGTTLDVTRLLIASGRGVDRRSVVVTTLMVAFSAYVPVLWTIGGNDYPADCPIGRKGWVVIAAVAAIFIILGREMLRYDASKRGVALERTLSGVFVSCYVGIPMAVLVMIRDLGDSGWGLAALITMIAVTKSADAGAYFSGKALGTNKLIPHLSPGKTWEGAIGGVATAVGVSYLCFFNLIPVMAESSIRGPIWGPIVFGTVCASAGMIGDLAESLVKRETGVKDSGRTLPGLGGVWDVTDSLIAAVIPAWVALAAGIAGM
jgi:phosphatidate cytidylyltransferase